LNMHSKESVSARRSRTFRIDFLGKKAGRVKIEAKTKVKMNIVYVSNLQPAKKGKER
jgi:hypothetical protein